MMDIQTGSIKHSERSEGLGFRSAALAARPDAAWFPRAGDDSCA
jgi:hypothetical protein